jgi:hypothetical protein
MGMGLDMYLNRMPRYRGATAKDVSAVEKYLDWKKAKEEGSEYAQGTFKDWCRLDRAPQKEYRDFYSKFYRTTYSAWDTEKKYGYTRIMEQVGYWRKANQIHNWFVENIQDGEDDCDYHREVTKEDLEELLDICLKVKDVAVMENGPVVNGYTYKDGKEVPMYDDGATIINSDEIAELLPTQGGFFFGGTDYDSYYMDDIENTIDIITKVLETTDFDKEMIYYVSSW